MSILLCVAFIMLPACDSGGSSGDDDGGTDGSGSNGDTFSITEGSFTVTVDGGDTASGQALFGVDTDQNEFVVFMLAGTKSTDDLGDPWTEVVIRDGDDPTVPSQTGPDSFSRWDMNSPDFGKFYGAPEGSTSKLTIKSVSDTELKGDFNFQTSDGKTVVGAFTAKPTDVMNQVVCAPDCDDT